MIENHEEEYFEFQRALETEVRREEADFKELEQDFEFVKSLNTMIASKYEDVLSSLPTLEEIDHIIAFRMNKKVILASELENKERLFQLRRFRSLLVMIEKDKAGKIPIKYDELNHEKP